VALHIYGNEKEWARVRKDCCLKLDSRRDFYAQLMPWIDVDSLYKQIAYFEDGFAPRAHWMSLPEVGFLVATKYNVVLVSYGFVCGITCLPGIVPDGGDLREAQLY
ncbi:hypothetical protein Leryth_006329, partial [Lithospermum erythrorhizon]